MPPSKLKRLKASIHEQRSARQNRHQKSKQHDSSSQPQPANGQASSKPAKPLHAARETSQQKAHRLRQERLLPELQRRNKVGGIVDRRIGENDPTLAPEERMLQRYAVQSQRSKRASVFDLEGETAEEDGEVELLMHRGRPLREDVSMNRAEVRDDYEERDSVDRGLDPEEKENESVLHARRKRRLEDAVDELTRNEVGEPASKKSRKEIMEEVIKKSKLYKHERQQVKDQDEEAREELDKELPDLLAILKGKPSNDAESEGSATKGITESSLYVDSDGKVADDYVKSKADLEYDQRIRLMAMDKRAQPTQKTKTEEQRAEEEAHWLERLQEERLRRMNGEKGGAAGHEEEHEDPAVEDENHDEDRHEAAEFGFKVAEGIEKSTELEDEDDFIIDEDLVASGSEIDSEFSSFSIEEESQATGNPLAKLEDDEDAEFLKDVLTSKTDTREDIEDSSKARANLAYTYPCPHNLEELLSVMKSIPYDDQPVVIQRIRAIHHPQLAATNKSKIQAFATCLVEYISYLPLQKPSPPLLLLESIIRHIHSLSRSYALPIAEAFRHQLRRMQASLTSPSNAASSMTLGDLILLTAISTIYPTSDHFHAVVTPAMILMARWLGTTSFPNPSPQSSTSPHFKDEGVPTINSISQIGAYLTTLCARFQRLSHRYVPETLRFTLDALSGPTLSATSPTVTRHHLSNLSTLIDLWRDSPAFIEIFQPAIPTLTSLKSHPSQIPRHASAPSSSLSAKTVLHKLRHAMHHSQLARRPLLLHNHAPHPIPSTLPKLESDYSSSHFHPAHHNDPDAARAEGARVRKEYKKERKGAMRELRRDAEFVAREKLREKREKDRLYEEKMRKLVGGVQTEEGSAGKAYEKEKEKEKRRSKSRF